MLVLNQKCQQSVVIAGDGVPEHVLKVTVLKARGGRVRLGLEVPAGIRIERRETWEAGGGAGQPCDPDARPAACKQESDRWEDDGGGSGFPAAVPAVLRTAMRLAECHR